MKTLNPKHETLNKFKIQNSKLKNYSINGFVFWIWNIWVYLGFRVSDLGFMPASKSQKNAGQALLELSIFGSIILMLLGLLISYGLKYNFQQQAQMEAQRKALELAAKNGSGSYTIVKDRHIPTPESPFGVGGVQPFMASASATRDYQADATADDYAGLPKMTVHFQGKENGKLVDQERSLATAGRRQEVQRIPGTIEEYRDLKEKYGLVYGSVSGWPDESDKSEARSECSDGDDFQEDCAEEFNGDEDDLDFTLTIVDSCDGEIVDYNTAVRQAKLIVDTNFCIDQCEKGKKSGSTINCTRACGYGIEVPWYAQGAYNENGKWIFPHIEELFYLPLAGGAKKRVQGMGPQSDFTQQVTTDFQTHRTEDDQAVTTTDDVYWNTTTTRTILYNEHLDKDTGIAQPAANLKTEDYTTTRAEQESTSWQTRWGVE